MVGCSFSSRGVLVSGLSRPFMDVNSGRKPPKRGKITRFSEHSAIRLRETLLRYVGRGDAWAFTLTFPSDLSRDDYFAMTKRFFQQMRYHKVGVIWRVELTRRKRPHLHCVIYSETFERVFLIMRSWWDVVNAYAYVGGVEHSVVCRPVSGVRWWQYVAAHSSKAKSSQLGWHGRQWGVVCRPSFRDDCKQVSFSPDVLFRVLRVLRRLSHCRNNQRGLFGGSAWFCGPWTASRIVDWAMSEGSTKP